MAQKKAHKKPKLKGRARGKVYTEEQKAEIIKLVEHYGNISRVSRETGVSRPTIENWLKGIPQSTKMDKIRMEKKIEKKLEKNEEQFIKRVYEVKEEALERIHELLNTTKSLRDVTQAFATLSAVGIGDKDKDVPQTVHNTFINRIYKLRQDQGGNKIPENKEINIDDAKTIDDDGNEEITN